MKPFNLERALEGDKVVTRNGREATQITKFDVAAAFSEDCLYCVVDGTVYSFNGSGRFGLGRSDLDLFMAPKVGKHKRWVNLYDDGYVYSFAEEADSIKELATNKKCLFSRIIEWEAEE